MLKWLDKIQPAVFIAFCICFTFQPNIVKSATDVSYEIADISASLSDNAMSYSISGSSPPVYNVTERFAPFRVIVDVAGALYSENLSKEKVQLPQNDFASLKVIDVKEQPAHMRFEFTLSDSHDYSVEKVGNSLHIKMFPAISTKPASAPAQLSGMKALNDFKVFSTPNTTTISIISNGPIENYTVNTIGSGVNKPPRMYIDIEDVAINELVPEKLIGTSVDKIRVAKRGTGARIVFDSASQKLFKYTVAPSTDGLDIVIDESNKTLSKAIAPSTKKDKPTSGADSTLDQLIGSSEQLRSQDPDKLMAENAASKLAVLEEDFSFSGYKKQRISVDFYKIDIHNVFRLFRQITDLNIIVDEQVQGLLTLALTDVPWDFALDIILNLMDLKKEERFNTIVIYPATKAFVWPTRAEDNLAFEADIEIIQQEALVIEKSATQSKEVMLAKEFMAKAQNLETREEWEDAALLYSKAFELWPENSKISNRLATLYLVNLGMNAKAVYYAKESLKHDPKNANAALYAAIASANMQRIPEAKEYFSQSISNSPPMKEALMSFATFSENNGQNEAALKLLDKYHQYYGESFDTMVAKARVLDKLGRSKDATQQYQAILTSGFQLRSDLKRYIEGRLSAKELY